MAADYEPFVRLFAELRVPESPPPKDQWERVMMPRTRVAERRGEVHGYVYTQTFQTTGYLRHIVVDPTVRGQRLGHLLMADAAQHLVNSGCTGWCLNVKPDNVPARALYTSVGMKHAYDSASFEIAWATVLNQRVDPLSRVVSVAADVSGEVEAQFGLPAGQLVEAERLGRIVRAVRKEDEWAGLAAFDPLFPGSFPFHARDVRTACTLLQGLFAYARKTDSVIHFVVENHQALAQEMQAIGARPLMRFEHWRGALKG